MEIDRLHDSSLRSPFLAAAYRSSVPISFRNPDCFVLHETVVYLPGVSALGECGMQCLRACRCSRLRCTNDLYPLNSIIAPMASDPQDMGTSSPSYDSHYPDGQWGTFVRLRRKR